MRGRNNRWSRGGRVGNRHGGFNRGGYGRGVSHGGPWGRGFGGSRDGNRFNTNNQRYIRPKNNFPEKRLSEDQIGVTEYMSEQEGFNGIIKSRYSDFQVAEINLRGEVAQLTDTSPPQPPTDDLVEEDEELLLNKYNVEILPMELWDKINKVAAGTVAESVEIDVTTSTKEERTKIHEAVKKAFGGSIVGSTFNKDDKKFVKFDKYKKGVRIDTRVKWPWPGEFVHFLVHKENCDTMEAASKIADRLRSHIRPSMIGYAGTKDRRAKTTQWFSLKKIDPKKISAACRDLRELKVGNYSFHDHHLKLGMLRGNKFRIALRNVTADDSVVEAACARLAEHGFINYYGLQRFGTRLEVPTFDVGRKLLKGNFQEAIDSILCERDGPLQEVLSVYKQHGPAAAARALPRSAHYCLEGKLILALADKPNDLHYALQKVPRNTRLLYLHSYQSLIWNRCVSERIRRLGLRPAAGDLVPLQPGQITEDTDAEESDSEETDTTNDNTTDNNTETTDDNTETIDDKNTESTETIDKKDTEFTDNKNAETTNNKKSKKNKQKEKEKVPVKVLTQEDVDSGNYTIYDIVMPLPGHFIEYPPNMKEYYEELLTNDGLGLVLKHKNKSYCMSGAYRAVCARAGDVSWRLAAFSDPRADLLLSDADRIAGSTTTGILDDGEYKALLLTMSLPPSCYATMALRELLRADTSAHNQALHNNYHEQGSAPAAPAAAGTKRSADHAGGDEKRPREGE